MQLVKTYESPNHTDASIHFGISKMETSFAKRNGEPDQPHRHNYYTVLITKKATGQHFIDFNEYQLGENQIYFISPGQVHQIIEKQPSKGYSIVFSNEFLVRNIIPVCFIEDLNLFNDFGDSPPLQLNNKEMEKVVNYANEIYEIFNSKVSFKDDAIGALLKLILIQCNNICSLPKRHIHSVDGKNSLLSNFKNLINEKHKEWHNTTEYAQELNISPDHLNRVVKSLTGKTAKEHIQSRIIVAAKRMLFFTDLSSKEISFELGFSEPANFSAFFKNNVGISPIHFKENF